MQEGKEGKQQQRSGKEAKESKEGKEAKESKEGKEAKNVDEPLPDIGQQRGSAWALGLHSMCLAGLQRRTRARRWISPFRLRRCAWISPLLALFGTLLMWVEQVEIIDGRIVINEDSLMVSAPDAPAGLPSTMRSRCPFLPSSL